MSGAAECKVCDALGVVAVGTGAQTNFAPCPSCVGIDPDALTELELEDARRMCEAEGVPMRTRFRDTRTVR